MTKLALLRGCARKGFIFLKRRTNIPMPRRTCEDHAEPYEAMRAKGGEVFHSLRGDAIDEMRDVRRWRLEMGKSHGLLDLADTGPTLILTLAARVSPSC